MSADHNGNNQKNIFVSIGSIILLVVILVAFVFLPATDMGANSSMVIEFGRYGNESIISSPDSFFVGQAMRLNQQYGQFNIDPSIIWRMAFNESMNRAAKIDEARRAGIRVSQREAVDLLKNEFTQQDGTFDRAAFLKLSDATKQQAINDISQNISLNRYENGVTGNILRSTEALNFFANPSSTARSFEMAIFYGSDYPDSNVIDFAEEYDNLFRSIELERIVFSSKKEALAGYKKIGSGEQTFEDFLLMNANSQDDMGNSITYFYEITNAVANLEDAEAVINLNTSELTKPVELKNSGKNFAIYRAKSQPKMINSNEEDELMVVRNYLFNNEKTIIADYLTNESAKIDVAQFAQSTRSLGGASLQVNDITPLYNLDQAGYQQSPNYPYLQQLELFKQNFTNQRGGFAASLLKSKDFFVRAFSLGQNELSAPIMISDDTFAVIRLSFIGEQPMSFDADERLEGYLLDDYRMALSQQLSESSRYHDKFDRAFAKLMKNGTRGGSHAGHDHD